MSKSRSVTPNYNETPFPSPQMPRNSNIQHAYSNSLMEDEIGAAAELSSNNSRPTSPTESSQFYAARQKPNSTQTPSPTNTAQQPDIINEVIGDFGIWQLRTVLIIFLCKIPAAWFMACIIFTGPELYPRTEFECDRSANDSSQISISNDQCYVYEKIGTKFTKEPCTKFNYDFDFYSLVMQYDLVCLRDIFVAWTQYWHLFGVLVGGVVGTKMMLRISPRNTYFIGMLAQIICGVVTGYSPDFSMHCAFRCLSAVCCAIMFTSGQAIFADITAGIYRTAAIILYDTFWSIGVILLPTLSSWFNSWAHIYLGITFPTLLLMVLLQWTPESPRWLLKNGCPADVERVEWLIREAAEINEREYKIPYDIRWQLERLREKLLNAPPPASWTQLWGKHHRAKVHMIAAHLALSAFIINFMGMLLNIRSFGRDYLVTNTVLMGFAEIVGCFLALHFTLKHNKWKWQCAGILNIIAGLIGCLGWTFSRNDTMNPLVKVTIWMIIATIPKAGVSCAQSMLYACLHELMPANKKIPFVFSVVTFARVWLLSAPFFNVLKKVDVALSLSSYCVLSIIGGICTCFLLTPRTNATTPVVAESVVRTQNLINKEETSPLRPAVWTVDDDGFNSKL